LDSAPRYTMSMAFQRKALHNRAFQRKALHSHRSASVVPCCSGSSCDHGRCHDATGVWWWETSSHHLHLQLLLMEQAAWCIPTRVLSRWAHSQRQFLPTLRYGERRCGSVLGPDLPQATAEIQAPARMRCAN